MVKRYRSVCILDELKIIIKQTVLCVLMKYFVYICKISGHFSMIQGLHSYKSCILN